MKVLLINKFFYLHGGVERYFFNLSKLLKKYDHNLAYFSMRDSRNVRSKWNKYFTSNISFNKRESLMKDLAKVFHLIYSFEAKRKINKLLEKFSPDIVHLRSIYHHISPSILPEIKKHGKPIVQTLGDYHLISTNYNMFHDGRICEITKPDNFYKAILHRCVKSSFLYSIAEVLEKYIHYYLGWEQNYIDYFISPSLFMKKKLAEFGISADKIIHLSHFIHYSDYTPNYDNGRYVLFFGRISPEKGIDMLIDTFSNLPQIKLIIAGRGDIAYEQKISEKALRLKNIKFAGFRNDAELKRLILNCKFTVLPSVWYENFPNSILESFALEKPVIASNIGGIPEIVKDGYNGLLFEPGNVDDCIEKINKLWSDPTLCRTMGKNAREYVEKNFSPEDHYEKLMEIYKKAIRKHR